VTGRALWVWLHLLDHQLVDRDGVMVGKVDDLEIALRADRPPVVAALLSGPGILATRMGHDGYGRWRERIEHAIDGPGGRTSHIPLHAVRRIGSTIELSLPAIQLANFGTERWVGDHLIGHIPGARHRPDHGPEPDAAGTSQAAAPVGGSAASDDDDGVGWVRGGSLLRRQVQDASGAPLGHVLDVRLVQAGPVGAGFEASLRVEGLAVGHGRMAQRGGLLRHEVRGPWLLRQALRLTDPRRSFVPWAEVIDPMSLADDGPVRVDADALTRLPD
jgi:sporulation protein YlmC with PRC-barrel domain